MCYKGKRYVVTLYFCHYNRFLPTRLLLILYFSVRESHKKFNDTSCIILVTFSTLSDMFLIL